MDKRYKRSESVEDVIKAIVVAKAKLILEFLIKKTEEEVNIKDDISTSFQHFLESAYVYECNFGFTQRVF